MKQLLTIALIWLLALPVSAGDDSSHLADEAEMSRIITYVLDKVVNKQLNDLKRRNPTCFHGAFEREVEDYLRGLARQQKVHRRVLSVLGESLTNEEIRRLARFYDTAEGERAMFRFTRSISSKNQGPLKTDHHPFFQTDLGQKIVTNVPAFKRRVKWQALMLIKDNVWGAGSVFLKELNLNFKCKNAKAN